MSLDRVNLNRFQFRSENKHDFLYKVVFVGDSQVGKSSLMPSQDPFRSEFKTTIGVELGHCHVETDDGRQVVLQVWDTAGQERFKSLTRGYYRGAKAYVLIYSLTNKQSFENLTNWLSEFQLYGDSDAKIFLVGNKNDKENERQVTKEEAVAFAAKHNLVFCGEMNAGSQTKGKNTDGIDGIKALYIKITDDTYAHQLAPEGVQPPAPKPKPFVKPASSSDDLVEEHKGNLALANAKQRQKTASIVTGIVAGVVVALTLSLLAYFFWPVIVTMGFIVAGAAALGINLTATAILGTVLGGLGAAGLFGTGVGFFTNFMYPKVASRLGATSQSESSSKPRRDSIPLMPVGTPSTNPQPGSQPSAQLDPAAPQSQQNAEPYVAGSPRV